MAHFTPRSIERLIDLVENKLSCLDVIDREDRMEMKLLQRALDELHQYEHAMTTPKRSMSLESARASVC